MKRRAVPVPEGITKVNVTPIIDVALVLVIILMVTAPLMTTADLPVNLPVARTREAERERNVSVTLGSDGRLAVDDRNVPADSLLAVLTARLAAEKNPNVLVVVRADSHARHVQVRTLLDAARDAGAQRIAIATRQKVEAGR
jgi:biopolymer transport protein ExbD